MLDNEETAKYRAGLMPDDGYREEAEREASAAEELRAQLEVGDGCDVPQVLAEVTWLTLNDYVTEGPDSELAVDRAAWAERTSAILPLLVRLAPLRAA